MVADCIWALTAAAWIHPTRDDSDLPRLISLLLRGPTFVRVIVVIQGYACNVAAHLHNTWQALVSLPEGDPCGRRQQRGRTVSGYCKMITNLLKKGTGANVLILTWSLKKSLSSINGQLQTHLPGIWQHTKTNGIYKLVSEWKRERDAGEALW